MRNPLLLGDMNLSNDIRGRGGGGGGGGEGSLSGGFLLPHWIHM